MWTCAACGRQFGRRGQGHECAPALSLREYLATGPPHERAIVEAVLAHVRRLGPVTVEPVSVGVLLKHGPTFAELRPMTRWEALHLNLPAPAQHPSITRKVVAYGRGYHHVARLTAPGDVDEGLQALLAEAYAFAAR